MNAPDWFYTKTPLFHITVIDNLTSILNARAIYAKNKLTKLGMQYTNIAHEDIQINRNATTLKNGDNLHDYVPFAFAPLSPMLYALHNNKIKDCTSKQDDIVYLVTNAQALSATKFLYTDAHPLSKPVKFYDKLNDIRTIDWEIFFEPPLITPGKYARFWLNRTNPEKPKWVDRKRKRMAEFLVYDKLPWHLIDTIVVKSEAAKTRVEAILKQFKENKKIEIFQEWYY